MRQTTSHIVATAVALSLLSASAASAIECKLEMPAARSGYWSWRIIDGKRCWYSGRPGMEKANLQWPKSAPPPPVDTKNQAPLDTKNEVSREAHPDQVSPEAYSAKAQSYSPEPEELSFKERWPQ